MSFQVSVNILQMAKGEVSSLASKHPLHQEYEFLYADTVAVKVINSLDMKFEPRFNALYRFLLTNEEKTESPAKLFGRVKLLKAAEELLGQHDREAQVERIESNVDAVDLSLICSLFLSRAGGPGGLIKVLEQTGEAETLSRAI